MIHFYPSVYFGTLGAESIRIACIVPKRIRSVMVHGLDYFTDVEIAPGVNDYWLVEMGTVVGQMEFQPSAQHATPIKGTAKGRNAVSFPAPVAYASGAVVALRALPVGSPANLTSLQVVIRIEEP